MRPSRPRYPPPLAGSRPRFPPPNGVRPLMDGPPRFRPRGPPPPRAGLPGGPRMPWPAGPRPPYAGCPRPPIAGGPRPPIAGGPRPPIAGGPRPPIAGGPRAPIAGGPRPPTAGGPRPPTAGGPRAPIAGGPRPPIAGGPRAPIAGGPRPPTAGGPRPPTAGGPRAPIAGGPRPPTAGGPRPPIAGGPRPPIAGGPLPPNQGGPRVPNPHTVRNRFETIDKELSSGQLRDGGSDLLGRLTADDFFYQRMQFVTEAPKLPYMEASRLVRLAAAGLRCDDFDYYQTMHEMLQKTIGSGLLAAVVSGPVQALEWEAAGMSADSRRANSRLLTDLVAVLSTALKRRPSTMKQLATPVTTILRIVKLDQLQNVDFLLTDDLRERVALLELQWSQAVQDVQPPTKAAASTAAVDRPPPDDFREMDVFPTAVDFQQARKAYLRPNVTEGSYKDSEHYLDVWFRLMRADYIRPLSDGIQALLRDERHRQKTVNVYRSVRLEAPLPDEQSGAMIHVAQFQQMKRVRWQVSKRLMYGSLVCLSADMFESNFLFATIHRRDPEQLKRGCVQLYIERADAVDHAAKYVMVESGAYFEAYRHQLAALQRLGRADGPLPMQRYVLKCERVVEPPAYLAHGNRVDFSALLLTADEGGERLGDVLADEGGERLVDVLADEGGERLVDVLADADWPTREELSLDESQYAALRLALRHELALIQGPPGTGKTFIGFKIVQLLLANEHVWNPHGNQPILIVCYTNHALDQFLESISAVLSDGIVRVGSRCQNENLQKFLLAKVREKTPAPRESAIAYHATRPLLIRLSFKLNIVASTINRLSAEIVRPNTLAEIMPDDVAASLKDDDAFLLWLTSFDGGGPGRRTHTPRMRPDLMRELINMGYPETLARPLLWHSRKTDAQEVAEWFYFNPAALLANVRVRWPRLAHIDMLLAEGYPEEYILDAFESAAADTHPPAGARQWLRQIFGNTLTAAAGENKETAEEVQIAPEDLTEDRAIVDDDPWLRRNAKQMEEAMKNVNHKFYPSSQRAPDAALRRLALVQQQIVSSAPTNAEPNAGALWTLPLRQRWQLYADWTARLRHSLLQELHDAVDEYRKAMRRMEELREMRNLHVMRSAKVLGMTTTAAARHLSKLRDIGPRVVVIEEAAEILEPHVISSLNERTEHVILIGDHQQLRPTASDYHLAKHYKLDVSLFERLINNGMPFGRLAVQHRMRPEISQCLMPHFYDSLTDADSVRQLPDVAGVGKNLFFLNHSHHEDNNDSDTKSYKNLFEVDFAIGLCRYLLQQGYDTSSITILCCYAEQLFALKLAMQTTVPERVRVTVVDNYQGEECDIIILSMVRSNNDNRVGFLKTKNRICVALSRAKRGFFCIGNFDFLAANSELWTGICQSLRAAGSIGAALPIKCLMHEREQQVASLAEFAAKAPEGGCEQACGYRMDCGHTCEMPCHNLDLEHVNRKCHMPCARVCQGVDGATNEPYRHPCKKRCFKKCGDCPQVILRTLPCGHKVKTTCGLPLEKIKCTEPCTKLLPCHHKCQARCSQPCTANRCTVMVLKRMACDHQIEVPCFENPATKRCTKQVEKVWPICGHRVEAPCYMDENTAPCPQPCGRALDGCLHACSGTCGQCRRGRLHARCMQKCERVLICGHACKGECCTACEPCKLSCETRCTHNVCGRRIKGKKKFRSCGVICPPCNEKCSWACAHGTCTRKCCEPCDRDACSKPCRRPISCGTAEDPHYCIGVCGEPCPQIIYKEIDAKTGKPVEREACWQCMADEQRDELREIFFGDEDEADALFIQLDDCGHIFEMKAVDRHVRQQVEGNAGGAQELITLKCPRCNHQILKTQRFGKFLKRRFVDIQKVKAQMRGKLNLESLESARRAIYQQLHTMLTLLAAGARGATFDTVEALAQAVCKPHVKDLTQQRTSRWENLLRFVRKIGEFDGMLKKEVPKWKRATPTDATPRLYSVFSKWLGFRHISCGAAVESELQGLRDWLVNEGLKASELQITEFNAELHRFGYLLEVCGFITQRATKATDLADEGSRSLLNDCFGILFGSEPFAQKQEADVKAMLARLRKMHPSDGLGVSARERDEIVRAIGLSSGHWYRCPNNHIYAIADCGGANQASRCPECAAPIGGVSHQLAADNTRADRVMLGRSFYGD